ncbi:glycerol-3-phosphate 1-O-acyltransferase PlsY [Dellaglioa algida]|nr:glycerol-3-phosphate 1-O-acyltransferase PlsY [Dellaglioa algida]MDK1716538.1 glycerol-3-phosphate 1-O-acyltransferase PlsY [Dellaglioa algida]MDK1718039.1 glycerol-3-phosphate 1-O-acyltransferase PlsY [Dellaglioa algida]MDK1719969.1 glycerol-3-phosphate 1-O-acyltransferase PlsY [Dellaglioa algida]MDK1721480.1 glycerol-3-phosphate 1-O-acyltransferase PlsY [Dellaglioa algida]MDK1723298.1 glycerol-3-phosphate 1-O-acyltransferase PlsY [Dellaglioa algida]
MGTILLMLTIAYLLGSIPSGVWIGKYFYQKDIREFGSGNVGTTNTYRVLGPKAGTIVLVMDVSKGIIAASLPYMFGVAATVSPLLIGVGAVAGHTFSIFTKFKGGKAVATGAGILLPYSPLFFAIACTIFISLILLTSMVSVASVLGFIGITIAALLFQDWLLATIAGILTIFVIYKHRGNISRIFNGTESMVPFGLGLYLRNKKNR